MKTIAAFLSIDVVVQIILLVLSIGLTLITIFTFGETFIFAGPVLFFLGIWQVLSELIFGILRKDSKRSEFLILSLGYVVILVLGTFAVASLFSNVPKTLGLLLIFIFYMAIPNLIAFKYWKYSSKDLEKLRLQIKEEVYVGHSMDEILDSEEIFKPKVKRYE